MKIVIDDKIPYIKGAFEAFAEVHYIPGGKISKQDLKDADALITRTRTHCNKDLLDGSSIKFIATATIGFDHIDASYCKENGIIWTNAPGCNSGSVLQYVASVFSWLILEKGRDLSKMTIGVVGAGNVGSKVVKLCHHLGIKVLVNDPPRALAEGNEGFVSFDEVLEKADLMTFHVPLDRESDHPTFHMVNKNSLHLMKRKPILINSSRGEVVDNKAVLSGLQNGLISNLILDVWEDEPQIIPELLNCVDQGTPHIAGYSADGKANGTTMSVRAISAYFNLPLGDWNPEGIPDPKVSDLLLDCSGLSLLEAFAYAARFTYDINRDSSSLKESAEKFEWLRGNYPVRREFGSFNLKLENANNETSKALQEIGFNIC